MMSLEKLLAPVSEEAPGGEDLFDDPQRQEIEQAFEDDAATVDWRSVVELIEGQSGRSKDIWLAIYLARAGARMGRIDTVVTGCEMLAGLLDQYWDVLHPSMEEYGFQARRGACESLARVGTFLGPLKRIVLVDHPRLGTYTAQDLERFEAEGDSADGFGMFRHAIAEAPPEALQETLGSLSRIRQAIQRVDAALTANGGGETGTDFKATYQAIDTISRTLAPYGGAPTEDVAIQDGEGGGPDAPTASRGGRIESREDVSHAIDAIADYYMRKEPSSPILVALTRIRGWINMDFMSLLEDIAPGSVSEAGSVLLTRTVNESSDF